MYEYYGTTACGQISIPEVRTQSDCSSESPIFDQSYSTSMTKTSTKKRANKKTAATALATAAVTKKNPSLGSNTSTSKPQKKTRKKNVSHQQTIQARDTLDAEYHAWRTSVSKFHPFFPLPPIALQPYRSSASACMLYVYVCLI